jgi:hypothetical protein
MRRKIRSCALILGPASCTVGPDFTPPKPPEITKWNGARSDTETSARGPLDRPRCRAGPHAVGELRIPAAWLRETGATGDQPAQRADRRATRHPGCYAWPFCAPAEGPGRGCDRCPVYLGASPPRHPRGGGPPARRDRQCGCCDSKLLSGHLANRQLWPAGARRKLSDLLGERLLFVWPQHLPPDFPGWTADSQSAHGSRARKPRLRWPTAAQC